MTPPPLQGWPFGGRRLGFACVPGVALSLHPRLYTVGPSGLPERAPRISWLTGQTRRLRVGQDTMSERHVIDGQDTPGSDGRGVGGAAGAVGRGGFHDPAVGGPTLSG